MKLELGSIFIKDIQFASELKIDSGVLYVSKEALREVVLEDEKIKSVEFDIAKPGESVRITPVKDVIEPRVKVEGRGGIFPGVIAPVDTVGEGSYCRKDSRLPGRRYRYGGKGSRIYSIFRNP